MITTSEDRKRHRLLIVDDDQALLLLFSIALDSANFQNDCASGGEAALELLDKNRYDLVLLDLRMPDVSGLEVLARMRERGDLTEVIVVSAYVPGAVVLRAASQGVTTFLGKPVTIQFLRDTVESMLSPEIDSEFDRARQYARRLDFQSAYQVLVGNKDSDEIKKSLWAELFRALAMKGQKEGLQRLEGPSERLVTFQF